MINNVHIDTITVSDLKMHVCMSFLTQISIFSKCYLEFVHPIIKFMQCWVIPYILQLVLMTGVVYYGIS